jgi:cholesterol transport system auxiliary component
MAMSVKLFAKIALPVAAALSLSACVSLGGGKLPATLFTLTPEKTVPAGTAISGKPAEAIVVFEPETDRRLGVQRVAVQIDGSNIAYLQNAMWVERPARLFQNLLAETIRARSGKLVVLSDDNAGIGSLRLSGRLLDMGYDARALSVVVRFDAQRTEADGSVTTKRFESVIAGVAPDALQVGPALNQAGNEVAQQVAEWLSPPTVQTAPPQ